MFVCYPNNSMISTSFILISFAICGKHSKNNCKKKLVYKNMYFNVKSTIFYTKLLGGNFKLPNFDYLLIEIYA